MTTTWKAVLAGTAALAISACTPAETDTDETATAETTEESTETADDTMMADGDTAAMPEAAAEAAEGEGEGDAAGDDEDWGNSAGPLTADSE